MPEKVRRSSPADRLHAFGTATFPARYDASDPEYAWNQNFNNGNQNNNHKNNKFRARAVRKSIRAPPAC